MAISRPLDGAAAAAASAYAEYALTAALRSTRTYERYVQVVGCLARGQTSIETINACEEQVATSRLNDLSSAAASLYEALFVALLRNSYLPANGDFAPTEPLDGSPDPANATSPIESLMRQAADRDAAAVSDFVERLGQVANGELQPKVALRDAKAFFRSAPAERLATAVEAWFEFLTGLETLRADLGDECLQAVLASVAPGPAGEGVLELDGPSGQTASGEIVLDNEHEQAATVRCSVGDLRRADGIGPAFAASARVTPDSFTMPRGSSSAVRVSVHLDADVYQPDTPYVGILCIERDERTRTDVPVRIVATRPSA